MMKSRILTYCFVVCTLASLHSLQAQDMSNTSCGKVNNSGRIIVKGALVSVQGALIDNKDGTLICGGNTEIRQPEILGHVEYIEDSANTQLVPQIRHSIVRFSGHSPKLLDTSYNGALFVSVDTLISRAEVNLLINPRYPLIAWGRVTHDGTVNDRGPDASIILQGNQAQSIDGLGSYKTLELDNVSGAFVINNGGFAIQNNLYLHHGVFHNSKDNNVLMLNNSLVTRSDASSIEEHPAFINRYSLRYVGVNEIVSANEVPADSVTLKSMTVHNNGGLTMSRNITVNDSLVVGRDSTIIAVRTDQDTNHHTLTLTRGDNDPLYPNSRSEVIGTLRRTSLRTGSLMVFNNAHTGFTFLDTASLHGVKRWILDSRPVTYPVQGNGNQKVQRKLIVSATDENDSLISDGLQYRFSYAWVNDPGQPSVNESNSLDVGKVILQRWDEKQRWANYKTSITPAQTSLDNWAFSSADSITKTGFFAIGLPSPVPPMLAARVLMEGPYRNGAMATDLLAHNLIPSVPPDMFPYNLDANRLNDSMNVIPKNVVDWVVVELRSTISAKASYIKTGFLLSDGSIINPDGVGLMDFPDTLSSRDYYVVVHHRNHLSIMTDRPWHLVDSDVQSYTTLDFSEGLKVLGGLDALRPICFGPGQPTVYAMVAGDVNGDGVIDDLDRRDYDAIYQSRDREGYLNQDTDMSGIVTTRDINKSWNNRTRHTNVPRQ